MNFTLIAVEIKKISYNYIQTSNITGKHINFTLLGYTTRPVPKRL